jgi:hypothetical protein
MVVDVASKSPRSAAPGTKSIEWAAALASIEARRSVRNSSRSAARRASASRWPRTPAASAASATSAR